MLLLKFILQVLWTWFIYSLGIPICFLISGRQGAKACWHDLWDTLYEHLLVYEIKTTPKY